MSATKIRDRTIVRTATHGTSAPFFALARPQEERRERDARAMKTFEAGVAAISEEMEQKVLEASYTLRDGLEEAEQAVATVRGELDVDDQLVEGDMAYVEVGAQLLGHRETPECFHERLCWDPPLSTSTVLPESGGSGCKS